MSKKKDNVPKRKRVRWSQIVAMNYGDDEGIQNLEDSEAYVRGTVDNVIVVTVPRETFFEGKAGEVNAALAAMFARAGVEKDVIVLDEHVKFVRMVPVDLRVEELLERRYQAKQVAEGRLRAQEERIH